MIAFFFGNASRRSAPPQITGQRHDRWEKIKSFNIEPHAPADRILTELGEPDRSTSEVIQDPLGDFIGGVTPDTQFTWSYSPFASRYRLRDGTEREYTRYRLNFKIVAGRVREVWREAAPNDPPF